MQNLKFYPKNLCFYTSSLKHGELAAPCKQSINFLYYKIPKKKTEGTGLLHLNCDCKLLNIQKPINQVIAECNVKKFSDYIFSEKYIENGKMELFKRLGFNKEDSEYLKKEFERQAKQNYLKGDYIIDKLDKFGQRIKIKIKVQSKTRKGIEFISGWMIKPLGKIVCTTPVGD